MSVAPVKRPAALTTDLPNKRPKTQLPAPPPAPQVSASAIPPPSDPTAGPSKPPPQKKSRTHTHTRLQPIKPTTDSTISNRPSGSGLNNPTREIKKKDVIFVTRKTGLGMYLKRCKALLVDEGLNHITLHALTASIPHTLLLLHALIEILPYPKQHVWYEMKTGTVDCVDEVLASGSGGVTGGAGGGSAKGREKVKDKKKDLFGGVEEEESEFRIREKSSLQIIIHVSPLSHTAQDRANAKLSRSGKTARLNKAQRKAKKKAAGWVGGEGNEKGQSGGAGGLDGRSVQVVIDVDEEEMEMNAV